MAFTEDLDPFFADFGESCTILGAAQVGIFDKVYLQNMGIVAGNEPALLVKDGALGAATEGSAVVVRSTSYTVTGLEPDGTGMTLVRLEAS